MTQKNFNGMINVIGGAIIGGLIIFIIWGTLN